MNLESQVCSLELAKQLKELGVEKSSLFYWGAYENPLSGIVSEKTCSDDDWDIYYCDDKTYKKCPPDWDYPAYTVAELGEMLPDILKENFTLWMKKYENSWVYDYSYKSISITGDCETIFSDKTEANARAEMLIWLIENGHMKP